MQTVKAKFFCNDAAERADQYNPTWRPEKIELSVVSGNTPEDKIFQQASPGGELKLDIINDGAKGFFKPGKKYYVTFEEAED